MSITIQTTGPLDLRTLSVEGLIAGLNAVRRVEPQVPGITEKYQAALRHKQGLIDAALQGASDA